jgi:hypothetical protein
LYDAGLADVEVLGQSATGLSRFAAANKVSNPVIAEPAPDAVDPWPVGRSLVPHPVLAVLLGPLQQALGPNRGDPLLEVPIRLEGRAAVVLLHEIAVEPLTGQMLLDATFDGVRIAAAGAGASVSAFSARSKET